MKQNKQPKGSTEKSALIEFSGAEQELAELLEIQHSIQAVDEKLKGMIERNMKETTGKA